MAYTQNLNVPSPPIQTGNPNDERAQSSPGIRSATLNEGTVGGGGGGSRSTKPTTPAPGRTTSAPPKPKTPKPKPPVSPKPAPPPPPPIPPIRDPNITNPPAKEPQPAPPLIPNPTVSIEERPDRYKIGSDRWSVSAVNEGVGNRKEIKPLEFRLGSRPELKPVLKSDGIVVKVGEWFMVSPQTLADLTNSGNPHYDIIENGTLMGTPMGKSVPIVELDLNRIVDLGRRRDELNTLAGVRSVEYIYESPTVMGIPEALIQQVNYTLDPDTERPYDTYHLWDVPLVGNYTIAPIQTYGRGTVAVGGVVLEVPDKEKNKVVVTDVSGRVKGLREDLNAIKGLVFRGELAPNKRTRSYGEAFRVVAADGEPAFTPASTYIIKETGIESVVESLTIVPRTPSRLPANTTLTPDSSNVTTAGDQASKALGRWRSYSWTKTEGLSLREAAGKTGQTAPFITLATGESVGIGGTMSWGPTIGTKAKVILPYKLPKPYDAKTLALAAEYYGGDPDWEELNRVRIAELVSLTETIMDLELDSGGKRY